MKKVARWMVRWFWRTLACVLITVAVVVQLGRSFAYLAADYRPDIETYLGDQLQAQVHIGQLQLDWPQLLPSLSIRDLQIAPIGTVFDDHFGDEAINGNAMASPVPLTVASVNVTLDVLASLWQRRWVWQDVALDEVSVQMLRSDQRWQLQDLPHLLQRSSSPEMLPPSGDDQFRLADVFLLSDAIQFNNLRFHLQWQDDGVVEWFIPQATLVNQGDFHRLRADLQVDGNTQAAQLIVEAEGDPRSEQSFQMQGYFQSRHLSTHKLASLMGWSLWDQLPAEAAWKESQLDVALWWWSDLDGRYRYQGDIALAPTPIPRFISGASDNQVDATVSPSIVPPPINAEANQAAVGNAPVNHPEIEGVTDTDTLAIQTRLAGEWQASQWSITLADLQVTLAQQSMPPLNVQLGYDGSSAESGAVLEVMFDQLSLAPWWQWLQQQALFPDDIHQDLASTYLAGTLRQGRITLPLDDPASSRMQALMDSLHAGPFRGAPELTNVDGYIDVGAQDGRVVIDSQNGFSMFYHGVYAEPMHYRSLTGQVGWSLQRDNNAVYVNSSQLHFVDEHGVADGYMSLYLPWFKDTADSELILHIGLQQGVAALHQKYVPETINENLHAWLDNSIGSGQVPQAGFIYRGSLSGEKYRKRTVQLQLAMQAAELDYQAQWPALSGIDGQLRVDDARVSVTVSEAALLDSRLHNVAVSVTPNGPDGAPRLGVQADMTGPAIDGLRLLRETPLRDTVQDNFDSWQLDGQLHTSVELGIALDSEDDYQTQRIRAELVNAALALPNQSLVFNNLSGNIAYSDSEGLHSSNLKASLWGQPLAFNVSSMVHQAKLQQVDVSADGTVSLHGLQDWLGMRWPAGINGDVAASARLAIPIRATQSPPQLTLQSDLQGLQLDWPQPLAKSATQVADFELSLPLTATEMTLALSYRDTMTALLQIDGDSRLLRRGHIAFGAEAELPKTEQLFVSGQLPELDLQAWQTAITENTTATLRAPPVNESTSNAAAISSPLSLALQVEKLGYNEWSLDDATLGLFQESAGWRLSLQHPQVAGNLLLPAALDVPYPVTIDYLHIPEESSDEDDSNDPDNGQNKSQNNTQNNTRQPVDASTLSMAEAQQWPALDVAIADLRWGERELGQWRWSMVSDSSGVHVTDIYVQGDEFAIGSAVSNRGSEKSQVETVAASLEVSKAHDNQTQRNDAANTELHWWAASDDYPERSQLRATFSAGDLAKVSGQWQLPVLLNSEHASFDVQLMWAGNPQQFSPDALIGTLDLLVKKGSYERMAESGGTGILRLLGLFNFDTWARRLQLDFSDLYKSGLVFDRIEGQFELNEGLLQLSRPLQVSTASSQLQMAGVINLSDETIDTTLVATLPIAGNLTLATALAAGLPAAAGVYVISKLFEDQVDKVSSVSYSVNGGWDDPTVKFQKLFDEKAAREAGANLQQDDFLSGSSQVDGSQRSGSQQSAPQNADSSKQNLIAP